MKRIALYVLLATFVSSCGVIKDINCNIKAKQIVKTQQKADKKIAKKIEKMQLKGCDYSIDSLLSTREIATTTDTITITKERVVEIPSDALIFSQKYRCDSLGNLVLEYKRKLLRKPKTITSKVYIKGDEIIVECKYDSLTQIIETQQQQIINLTTNSNKKVGITVKEQPRNNWRSGAYFAIAFMVLLIVLIIALKTKLWKQ